MLIYPDLNKVMRGGKISMGTREKASFWPIIAILALILALLTTCAFADQGQRIVKIAESQIGKGEQGGNNKGKEVKKYTQGKEVPWCAGFVSWTLRHAGKEIPYLLSATAYWSLYANARIKQPKAGDIICFYRGGRKSGRGHVGIVEKVYRGSITTIEGNVGNYPAKVTRRHYKINNIPRLLGFVRII